MVLMKRQFYQVSAARDVASDQDAMKPTTANAPLHFSTCLIQLRTDGSTGQSLTVGQAECSGPNAMEVL